MYISLYYNGHYVFYFFLFKSYKFHLLLLIVIQFNSKNLLRKYIILIFISVVYLFYDMCECIFVKMYGQSQPRLLEVFNTVRGRMITGRKAFRIIKYSYAVTLELVLIIPDRHFSELLLVRYTVIFLDYHFKSTHSQLFLSIFTLLEAAQLFLEFFIISTASDR